MIHLGARGQIPERESNLARPRERKGTDEQSTKRGQLQPIQLDWQPDPEWGQLADMTWESAKCSGMADFYQDTDYAQLWFVCNELDRYSRVNGTVREDKNGNTYVKQSPEMVKALLSGLSALGFTEGDRRRVRIELEAPVEESTPASVLAIADYKAKLAKGSKEDDE